MIVRCLCGIIGHSKPQDILFAKQLLFSLEQKGILGFSKF